MTVVGVTGTNGKTSTVQLLAQAWTLRGIRCGTIGTLGMGLYGRVQPTGFTTPLVLKLHDLLAQLHVQGAQAVAMEVSSHALDQGRADGVHFDVAVFTNLTRDHLDYHGDMETYGAAKARLFAWPGLKAAAINLDDGYGRRLHAQLPDCVKPVGLSSRGVEGATLRADALRLDSAGIAFDLVAGSEVHAVQSPLLGRFNVDNLLAVAGALHALGDSVAQIAATLSQLQPIHGRMNRLGGDGVKPLVVIDYAHTPDALEQALKSLRAHAQARLICVFGCGGERDRGKRPQMAAIAEANADVVIVTDDNPRAENGDQIVADILAGFVHPNDIVVQRDRAAAIARAIGEASPDDIVLIAGKGHEPYQEIDGVKHPFDDTEVARDRLEVYA
jgi:UDP-N-acetylmuramoyl-L-alanyl-D-glutamate--2,6-diaminopimelate ligase